MATKFTFASYKPPRRAPWPKAVNAAARGSSHAASASAEKVAAHPATRPPGQPVHQVIDDSEWAGHANELAREPLDPEDAWLFVQHSRPTASSMPVNQYSRVATAVPKVCTSLDPYAGLDPWVPPGSHYDPWVWSILDRPGHVTVEIYVDAAAKLPTESRPRPMRPGAYQVPRYRPPACDLRRHCLISVPLPNHRPPWGDASRVLLVPMTRRGQPDASGYHEPYPPGACAWFRGAPDTAVILGHCLVAHPADSAGEREDLHAYWLVLPQHWARDVDTIGTLPARSLGAWHGFSAIAAVRAAIAEQGPVMPADWPDADVDQVRRLHPGFQGESSQDDAVQAGQMRPRG